MVAEPVPFVIDHGPPPVAFVNAGEGVPIHIFAAPPAIVAGKGFTVNVAAEVAEPPGVVTCTVPVVPVPTVTVTVVEVFPVIAAAVPPIVTAEAPVKLVPVITNDEPTHPFVVPKPVIVGGNVWVTHTVNALVVKSPL